MTINDFLIELDKRDREIERLKKAMAEMSENIKKIGFQNHKMKKNIERYQERLAELLFKGNIKNCSTYKNNVEFPLWRMKNEQT